MIQEKNLKVRYIDLDGPEGNVFVVWNIVRDVIRQIDRAEPRYFEIRFKRTSDEVFAEIQSSSRYTEILAEVERFLGDFIVLESSRIDLLKEITEVYKERFGVSRVMSTFPQIH